MGKYYAQALSEVVVNGFLSHSKIVSTSVFTGQSAECAY